jgi:hypothetical protein
VPIGYPYYNGFLYHGAPCYLPQGGQFSWDPPPPPPPCNASQALKNKCAQLGGWWDDETCSCQY